MSGTSSASLHKKSSIMSIGSSGASKFTEKAAQSLRRQSVANKTAMPKVDEFDVEFDDEEHVYFAGQEVTGHVVLKLSEEKRVTEILLEFKGRARAYWTKFSGKNRQHCSANEPYFCEQFNTNYTHQFRAKAKSDGKKESVLAIGEHRIPFSYTLPKSLPSSFEGDFGHVRYTCKAIMERPWDFDIICKRAYTVVGIEDVNEDPKSIDPVNLSESSHDIRYCCRPGGNVSLTLKLPRTGYAPGEAIVINASVENDSRKTLRYSAASIKQYTTYRAKTFAGVEMSKKTEKIVCTVEQGEIGAHSTYNWENVELRLPPVPPKQARCYAIDVSYKLEFAVDPGVKIEAPIFIGTIPHFDRKGALPPQSSKVALSPVAPVISVSTPLLTEESVAKEAEKKKKDLADDTIKTTESSATDEHGVTTMTKTTTTTTIMSNPTSPSPTGGATPMSIMKRRPARETSQFLLELYPSLPALPTFEHSTFGATDISDENETIQFGERKFTPKYPCYREHVFKSGG